ncbi:MAG: SPOR domain-containing protein, partial [Sphingomonas bacterium]|nr:SPOR domain-containing protein [Sphingomonas bacterium]
AVLNRDGEPILTAEVETAPPARSIPKLEIKRPPAPRPKVELASLDLPKAKTRAKTKVEAEKPKEAPKIKEMAKKKAPASPYFVQLASGAHADRMGIEYKRIKAKKPTLFAGRSAQVTNGKELFRLVIGPFKTRDDSGDFVNQLAKAGIDGFTYTAPDGMTFEKIATK